MSQQKILIAIKKDLTNALINANNLNEDTEKKEFYKTIFKQIINILNEEIQKGST